METATIHLASNGQITTAARFHPANCKRNYLSSAEMSLTNQHSGQTPPTMDRLDMGEGTVRHAYIPDFLLRGWQAAWFR